MAQDEKNFVPITLRIPRHVHARLKAVSELEYRSLNHQIIMALTFFVEMQERFGTLPSPEFLRKCVAENGKMLPAWLKSAIPGSGGRGARG